MLSRCFQPWGMCFARTGVCVSSSSTLIWGSRGLPQNMHQNTGCIPLPQPDIKIAQNYIFRPLDISCKAIKAFSFPRGPLERNFCREPATQTRCLSRMNRGTSFREGFRCQNNNSCNFLSLYLQETNSSFLSSIFCSRK